MGGTLWGGTLWEEEPCDGEEPCEGKNPVRGGTMWGEELCEGRNHVRGGTLWGRNPVRGGTLWGEEPCEGKNSVRGSSLTVGEFAVIHSPHYIYILLINFFFSDAVDLLKKFLFQTCDQFGVLNLLIHVVSWSSLALRVSDLRRLMKLWICSSNWDMSKRELSMCSMKWCLVV